MAPPPNDWHLVILLTLIPLLPGAALFAVFAIREGNRTHRTDSEQD